LTSYLVQEQHEDLFERGLSKATAARGLRRTGVQHWGERLIDPPTDCRFARVPPRICFRHKRFSSFQGLCEFKRISPTMNAAYSSVLVQNLKVALLDQRRRVAPASMLDCAAHMLLCFDEPATMYSAALRFMLERFQASRVDFGFGGPEKPVYIPSAVETTSDLLIPPFEGAFPNQIWPVQQVWQARGPVYQSLRCSPGIEEYWAGLGSKSKMARRLEVDNQVFGLVCIDDTDVVRAWDTTDLNYFDQFITQFFSPIIRAQVRLEKPSILAQLTAAEIAAVRLAACGLTYKEVAQRLGKSPNTVDNQLRSARAKLKVRNQVELAQACLKWL
jgi:DNA-binding CsgD family transcriptional regulator